MSKGYQAGGPAFLYPDAGDPTPQEPGAKVNILTTGGISTTGAWNPETCIGWAPLNSRDRAKEETALAVRVQRAKERIAQKPHWYRLTQPQQERTYAGHCTFDPGIQGFIPKR